MELAEGGIYEIAGHPTVVDDGELRRPVGSGLDICACVRGWKSRVSCTLRTGSRARVRRAQDTSDFGGQNP